MDCLKYLLYNLNDIYRNGKLNITLGNIKVLYITLYSACLTNIWRVTITDSNISKTILLIPQRPLSI